MQVEIWADIICPWCGLGNHRLNVALERFAHNADVEVMHRSFELDPGAPVGESGPVRDMLKAKKGMSDAQIESLVPRIETMAEAEGLRPYVVLGNQAGSTALAHELLAYASAQGKHAEAWNRMFAAYFGAARPIFDVGSLVDFAAEIGLDAEGARAALTSRRYRAQVAADAREAARLGATGIPFIVIDRRYAIAGAQAPDTILEILERAWEESHPVPSLVAAANDSGGACGPDGCAMPGPDHAHTGGGRLG